MVFTAQDILDIAIRLENNGEKIYLDAKRQTADGDLKALLDWIAEQERSHAHWFEDLKERLSRDEDFHLKAEMSRALVEEAVQGQAFSLQTVDFRTIDTPDKMIRIFIGFEEDTIAFYEILEALIADPSILEQLGKIVDEEKGHIAKFRQMLAYD
jgi:rubrerythrin